MPEKIEISARFYANLRILAERPNIVLVFDSPPTIRMVLEALKRALPQGKAICAHLIDPVTNHLHAFAKVTVNRRLLGHFDPLEVVCTESGSEVGFFPPARGG